VPQCGSKLEALTSHRSSTQLFCSFNSASVNAFFNVFDRLWLITALFYLPFLLKPSLTSSFTSEVCASMWLEAGSSALASFFNAIVLFF